MTFKMRFLLVAATLVALAFPAFAQEEDDEPPLLTIEEKDPLVEVLESFHDCFNRAYARRTLARLGLRPE